MANKASQVVLVVIQQLRTVVTQILILSVGGKPYVGPNTQTTVSPLGAGLLFEGGARRQSSLSPFEQTEQPPRNAFSVASMD